MPAMPMIFNDPGFTPVQLNMQGPVGHGGLNAPEDVKAIQMMLNAAPQRLMGLQPTLKVDGMAGTHTLGAIQRYQKAAKLKVVDSRIDPCGATIRSLGSTLIGINQFPSALPIATAPDGKFQSLIRPAPPPDVLMNPHRAMQAVGDSPAERHWPGQSSGWRIASVARVSTGIYVGMTVFSLNLERRSDQSKVTLVFSGAAVGLTMSPFTLEGNTANAIQQSTDMCFGGAAMKSLPIPVPLSEFISLAASMVTLSANLPVVGGRATSVFSIGAFGALGMYQALILTTQKGFANVGLTGYAGVTSLA